MDCCNATGQRFCLVTLLSFILQAGVRRCSQGDVYNGWHNQCMESVSQEGVRLCAVSVLGSLKVCWRGAQGALCVDVRVWSRVWSSTWLDGCLCLSVHCLRAADTWGCYMPAIVMVALWGGEHGAGGESASLTHTQRAQYN